MFDVQFQAARDPSITVGYSGNRGRHLVIPVPFNEPGIATPSHSINGAKACAAVPAAVHRVDRPRPLG